MSMFFSLLGEGGLIFWFVSLGKEEPVNWMLVH
jgi:hypothetical protein